MWLPNCGNWCKSCCSWVFFAGISLSVSTSECFEFASLQLPRFLAFLPLISFYYREDQGYPNLKLSTRTMGILVCLVTDLLWKFDGGYRRWDVFCVNRWHFNRIYTINQGTEKRRDTNPKLLTWTTGILVCLGTDFLWKFDGVYRRWNVFCVNRWHSNRYYTINQGTDKRRDTNLKLLAWTRVILVSLGTDFLWKFDGVYRRWNIFCVNCWHSNRYYTKNQETENHMDTTLIREIMRYHFH